MDQHSNNVSLFNVVEQVNIHPNARLQPNAVLPLELHAYWAIEIEHRSREFETRFVLVADTGLETPSRTFTHRPVTQRFRTRTMGLPFPPVFGEYVLHVDWRSSQDAGWQRQGISWPIGIRVAESKPTTTH